MDETINQTASVSTSRQTDLEYYWDLLHEDLAKLIAKSRRQPDPIGPLAYTARKDALLQSLIAAASENHQIIQERDLDSVRDEAETAQEE